MHLEHQIKRFVIWNNIRVVQSHFKLCDEYSGVSSLIVDMACRIKEGLVVELLQEFFAVGPLFHAW